MARVIALAVCATLILAAVLLGAFGVCRAARDEDLRVYYDDLGRASRRGSESSDRVQP